MIPNVRCVPFFTDTLISVDELWQQMRFDIRFKDIREIHPYKPDGTIAFSLPFAKWGGLFVWDLEVVTASGLAALVAATSASDAAAKAQPAPSSAARGTPAAAAPANRLNSPAHRASAAAAAAANSIHRIHRHTVEFP